MAITRIPIHESAVDQLVTAIEAFREKVYEAIRAAGPHYIGGFPAPYDPTELIDCFPHLGLREGVRLEAFQVIEGRNGYAMVVPVQADPKPGESVGEEPPAHQHGSPTAAEPVGAQRHRLVPHLRLDGSPESYFELSICLRELDEVGAIWHYCTWSTHTILRRHPFKSADLRKELAERSLSGSLEWLKDPPLDWRPVVFLPQDGSVVVEFFTYSGYEREGIFLHRDIYYEGYSLVTAMQNIGEGQGGYIF